MEILRSKPDTRHAKNAIDRRRLLSGPLLKQPLRVDDGKT